MLENAQRIAETIITAFAPDVANDGFEFDPTSSCFIRQDGDIRHVFLVPLSEKYGRLVCTPDVGVRSDLVEEIFHRTSEFSDSDTKNTSTLGVNVKLLTRSSDFDVAVANADDIEQAVHKLMRAFRDISIPYFDEYGSLEGIDRALNSNPMEPCVHMINERARCSKGLIVAKILMRSDYARLLETYDGKVLRAGEITYKKYFLPLVTSLEKHGV